MPKKACCLVSETLEEMGLDGRKARELRRQMLVGIMTFCEWQLARVNAEARSEGPGKRPPDSRSRSGRGRRVKVL